MRSGVIGARARRPTDQDVDSATIAYLPPEDIHAVIGHMHKAGYDDQAIRNIAGSNWMRIASSVWK